MTELAQKRQDELSLLTKPSRNMFAFIRVGQGLSKAVAHPKSKVKNGQFYISNSDPELCVPLGEMKEINGEVTFEIECVVGPWRAHAMRLVGGKVEAESFDINDPVFKEIMAAADGPGEPKGTASMYGPDTILYIPPHMINHEDYPDGCLGIYFFNKTAKDSAPAKHGIEPGTPIRLRSHEVHSAEYSWWVPNDREVITPVPEWAKGFGLTPEQQQKYENPGGGQQIEEAVDRSNMRPE